MAARQATAPVGGGNWIQENATTNQNQTAAKDTNVADNNGNASGEAQGSIDPYAVPVEPEAEPEAATKDLRAKNCLIIFSTGELKEMGALVSDSFPSSKPIVDDSRVP